RDWRRTADVVKRRPGVTSQPQIANRPPPPVGGPVTIKHCEADDALVGSPPTDVELGSCEGCHLMSAEGQSRRFDDIPVTSALLLMADSEGSAGHLRATRRRFSPFRFGCGFGWGFRFWTVQRFSRRRSR